MIFLSNIRFNSIVIESDESEELQAGHITGGDPVLQFLTQNPANDLKQLKQEKDDRIVQSIVLSIE